jgi:hypothetical protein
MGLSHLSTQVEITTQALHLDRGRLARSERAARKERLKLSTVQDHRTFGAHCGRAARRPSEELGWLCLKLLSVTVKEALAAAGISSGLFFPVHAESPGFP